MHHRIERVGIAGAGGLVLLRLGPAQARLVLRRRRRGQRQQPVRSGIGIAPLPANIADADTSLVRIMGPVPELARTWKLLTPKALRREPRIAAFFDFITSERQAVEAILN